MNDPKKSRPRRFFIVNFVICAALVGSIGNEMFKQTSLEKTIDAINSNLPYAIDKHTTWEKATAVLSNTAVYEYRINEDYIKSLDVTEKEILSRMAVFIKNHYCDKETNSYFLENKIRLVGMFYAGDSPYIKVEAGVDDCN